MLIKYHIIYNIFILTDAHHWLFGWNIFDWQTVVPRIKLCLHVWPAFFEHLNSEIYVIVHVRIKINKPNHESTIRRSKEYEFLPSADIQFQVSTLVIFQNFLDKQSSPALSHAWQYQCIHSFKLYKCDSTVNTCKSALPVNLAFLRQLQHLRIESEELYCKKNDKEITKLRFWRMMRVIYIYIHI
jgi:hypothetical protein